MLGDAVKGAAADKEDIFGVYLNELLIRVLSAALRGNIGNRTLKYLEQRLLNALARNVAGDGAVLAAAGYLIYFVDIDYSALRTLSKSAACIRRSSIFSTSSPT